MLGAVFSSGRPLAMPREMCFGTVLSAGVPIDKALAVSFPAPKSYTGEPMAEIHCHGGTLVSARVLEAVFEAGTRQAHPGEFTQRAFLNGKLDLTQAEAVMDLISAQTPPALRAAEEQLAGTLGVRVAELRERLLVLVANVEAWIDFPDDEIDPSTGQAFREEIHATLAVTGALLSTAAAGRLLREGVRLVLCGAPNAGKSSLMNRLLGQERAIVAETPGTTRDTIEEAVNFSGILFRITDTAGLRDSQDPVEVKGIERAGQAIADADVVVRVVDASTPPPHPETVDPQKEIVALNKIDLLDAPPQGLVGHRIPISCSTGEGIEALVDALVQKVCGGPGLPSGAAINARHQACLHKAQTSLQEALSELDADHSPEFVALGLRSALDSIGEIIGTADTEEILGTIFSRFCIGK